MEACTYCGEQFVERIARCPRCRAYSADGLILLLSDPHPEVRTRAAADMFFLLPSAAVARSLATALADPEVAVRRAAGVSLFVCGAQAVAALPALIAALGDPDRLVRRAAAASIWMIGPPASEALPKLVELRASEDKRLRGWAAQAEQAIRRHAPA